MKRSKKIFFSAVLLLNIQAITYAQFPGADRIRRQIVNKTIDKAADKAADQASDKIVESIFGNTQSSSNKSNSDSSLNAALGKLGSAMNSIANAVPPSSTYQFSSSYVMKMTSKHNSEANEMRYKYMFNKDGKYVGTKIIDMKSSNNSGQSTPPLSTVVFDFEKNSFYTFMENEGQKTYMGLMLNQNAAAEQYVDNKIAETKYTKLGTTKTIMGYTCDGYLMETPESKMTMWISRNSVPVVSSYYDSFKKMSNSNTQGFKINYDVNPEIAKMVAKGSAVLGMDSADKNGSEMHMEVVELNPNDNFQLNTTAYQNMMGGTPKN